MNRHDDILNELHILSPMLIGLRENVFTVPANYFTNLPGALLEQAKLESFHILPAEAVNTMDVPAGYFDSLASNILNKVKASEKAVSASEELKELSPSLYSLGNDNIYSVPAGYFDALATSILNDIKSSERILSASEELRELSPALYSVGNDNIYTVPRGYFDSFADQVIDQLKPAKVVSMKPRSKVLQYALAACITGILGFGIFTLANKENTGKDTQITASVLKDAEKIIETNSFEKVLGTISEEDIEQYLTKNGEDLDAAIVASAIDNKELPSMEDYITDENTLNKFLDELNVKSTSN